MKRISADSSHLGRMPRSYQVTPKVLGRRRATQPLRVRPTADKQSQSQPAASPRTNNSGRTSPPRPKKTMTVRAVSTAPISSPKTDATSPLHNSGARRGERFQMYLDLL